MERGLFVTATEMEVLEEEKELIQYITLEEKHFFGVHPTNTVPVSGLLQRDKQNMIDTIDKGIIRQGEVLLSGAFHRASL